MGKQSIDGYDQSNFIKFCGRSTLSRDLQVLKGIVQGIVCDSEINNAEIVSINHWINSVGRAYESKPVYRDLVKYLRDAISDNFLSLSEQEEIIARCEAFTKSNPYFDAITCGIQELHGVLKGISIDGKVNDEEIRFLDTWLEENSYLKRVWPYDEVYSLVTQILSDGYIDQNERTVVLKACQVIGGGEEIKKDKSLLSLISANVYHIDPEITISGQKFVITGMSTRFKRREIENLIVSRGGLPVNGISKSVNYLIVCANKNDCWAFESYGRKIEAAINLRKNGSNLVVAHENDLYDALRL